MVDQKLAAKGWERSRGKQHVDVVTPAVARGRAHCIWTAKILASLICLGALVAPSAMAQPMAQSYDGQILTRDYPGSRLVAFAGDHSEKVLSKGPANSAQYSRDGKQIAYDCFNVSWDICVMNSDGSGQRVLVADTNQDFFPTWSPDGDKIAFRSGVNTKIGEVWIVNSDGSGLRKITNQPDNNVNDISFSPDGKKVAFSEATPDGSHYIALAGVDHLGYKRLTNSGHDQDPSWAPDGKTIAFVSTRDPNSEIYFIDLASGLEKDFSQTFTSNDQDPSWSPSGKLLAFVSSNGPIGSMVIVSTADGSISQQVWSSDARIAASLTFSPSGRKLALLNNRRGESSTTKLLTIQVGTDETKQIATGVCCSLSWQHLGVN